MNDLRADARAIWQAAVDAVKPEPLVRQALTEPRLAQELRVAPRILVLGGGKAGSAMCAAVESVLADLLPKMNGLVNVPAQTVAPLKKIRLQAARATPSNQPTEDGVAGALEMLRLARTAGPNDIALCLISGGGSALIPAPANGIILAEKQSVTQVLHACGATINEMNAVRKHLSAIKGGRLAQAFRGKHLYSLIVSDVIGDPLDVIASGPTAADPTTFAEAIAVLDKYHLREQIPAAVLQYLERGQDGQIPETLKTLPGNVTNVVIGNNAKALAAAETAARKLGYAVLNLGSHIEGETRQVAISMAGVIRSIREQGIPLRPPVCLLSGGETTVTLAANHGKGGRNQEFVLAAMRQLGANGLRKAIVLSGGTDGEDGPTDAAGAFADEVICAAAIRLQVDAAEYLSRNDAYNFFARCGGLLLTGLTGTNVMDVRVILITT